MARAPAFWTRNGPTARLLSPLSTITRLITARRVARPGLHASVPVICCGNVTVGGAGKTTLALDLAQRLRARGRRAHALLRGYGGSRRGVHRVDPTDPAALVGDEAKLLAAHVTTWTGSDRGLSALAAIASGADVLLMDDGLQNPTLAKDLSLLVVDGASGFGNGRLLPAGPLREPILAAAARCQAVVLIGEDEAGALRHLPRNLPVLRAHPVQDPIIETLRGVAVIAFAGIARPDKFFVPLEKAGALVVERYPFPDHHPFTAPELDHLRRRAAARSARLVTTPKDAVRLPPDMVADVTIVGVSLAWEDPAALDALLARVGI